MDFKEIFPSSYKSSANTKLYCKAEITETYRSRLNKLLEKDNIPQKGQTCFVYQGDVANHPTILS